MPLALARAFAQVDSRRRGDLFLFGRDNAEAGGCFSIYVLRQPQLTRERLRAELLGTEPDTQEKAAIFGGITDELLECGEARSKTIGMEMDIANGEAGSRPEVGKGSCRGTKRQTATASQSTIYIVASSCSRSFISAPPAMSRLMSSPASSSFVPEPMTSPSERKVNLSAISLE